jgi:hypothetical protein
MKALAFVLLAACGAATACPDATAVGRGDMLGLWRVEFADASAATLLLEPHPEDDAGLAGGINRNGMQGIVAGDVRKGEFTLAESADGKKLAATFVGDVVPGSCGREIRGEWHDEQDNPPLRFVLRKL